MADSSTHAPLYGDGRKIMMDLLNTLADTLVPNMLVISGIVLLLLAVAGRMSISQSIGIDKAEAQE